MNRFVVAAGLLLLAGFSGCAPSNNTPGITNFPIKPGDTWQVEVVINKAAQSFTVQAAGTPHAIEEFKGMYELALTSQPGFGGNAYYYPDNNNFSIGVYTTSSRRDFFICQLGSVRDYSRPVAGQAVIVAGGKDSNGNACQISKR
jgi:hypothetical protein